jgi:hypothetical protein
MYDSIRFQSLTSNTFSSSILIHGFSLASSQQIYVGTLIACILKKILILLQLFLQINKATYLNEKIHLLVS